MIICHRRDSVKKKESAFFAGPGYNDCTGGRMVLTRPDKLETAGRRKKRHAIYPGRRVWKGEGENEGNRRAFAGAAEAAGGED